LLSAKKTLPGRSGQIEVRVKTADISGVVEKHIYVNTNDPGNSEVRLTVRATVAPEIALTEYGIFFGSVPAGKEARREVILTVAPGKSVRILGAETTDPRVSVKLEPVSESNGQKWKLIAIQKADAKPGYHIGEIVIKTSSRLNPKISVYERGTVTAPGK
jgi:hypothetical protein